MLGHMKQVPYCGPENISFHRTKFSRHGHLATGIAVQLHPIFMCSMSVH